MMEMYENILHFVIRSAEEKVFCDWSHEAISDVIQQFKGQKWAQLAFFDFLFIYF